MNAQNSADVPFFGHNSVPSLAKLFEDPDERENRIQNSIARSRQNKNKRKRLNSGSSNQSKVRSSTAIESASTAGYNNQFMQGRHP